MPCHGSRFTAQITATGSAIVQQYYYTTYSVQFYLAVSEPLSWEHPTVSVIITDTNDHQTEVALVVKTHFSHTSHTEVQYVLYTVDAPDHMLYFDSIVPEDIGEQQLNFNSH